MDREDRVELFELLFRRILKLESCRALELLDERIERAIRMVRRALITQQRVRLGRNVLGEGCRKARLADPRLACDQHDLSFALPGEALVVREKFDLVVAADHIDQTGGADRLEAALGMRGALDCPRRNWLGNALELMLAELAQMEHIAKQPLRGAGDNDCPWLGQGLESSRQVGRIAYDHMLARATLAPQPSNHNYPGCDANARREGFRRERLKLRKRGHDVEPGPHRALRIIFVRMRIAKIGQDSVASQFCDKAVISP